MRAKCPARSLGAYPGFFSMKRHCISAPPGWDVSPPQGSPQHYICHYPFIHLSGEGPHCESEVSCPRTERSDPGKGSNEDRSFRSGHKTRHHIYHTQPRPQANSRYPNEQRKPGTERDSEKAWHKMAKSPSSARKSPRYCSTKTFFFLRGPENISDV